MRSWTPDAAFPDAQDEIKIPVAEQIDISTMPVEDGYDGPRLTGEAAGSSWLQKRGAFITLPASMASCACVDEQVCPCLQVTRRMVTR